MFIGKPTNIRPMWHQGGCGTTWRTFIGQKEPMNVKDLRFVGFVWPTNIR
jgi:hypothetical protein